MTTLFVTFVAVAVLLLTAVPGFAMIKTKMISESCVPGCSKILLFVCSPCLMIYSLNNNTFSWELMRNIGIFALLTIGIQGIMLTGAYFVLRKKYENALYRIITIATTFGNCSFFGNPLIEALLPEQAPSLIMYTAVYALIMNVLGWTVGSAIISGNAKYISMKKIVLNPATIGAVIAFAIFILRIPVQKDLYSMITICGRMSTPLSMLIMGMRLATCKFRDVFCNVRSYLTILVKMCLMPLIAFAGIYFLPIDPGMKQCFYIVTACPVASVVLNFSEILGEGQKEAASLVLLGTMGAIVTMPIMMLLLGFLA
ncbi:MAG: AEC family transporter [Clostridia bacterium]|nr:AEC family transporter [Clostridia bacterium]